MTECGLTTQLYRHAISNFNTLAMHVVWFFIKITPAFHWHPPNQWFDYLTPFKRENGSITNSIGAEWNTHAFHLLAFLGASSMLCPCKLTCNVLFCSEDNSDYVLFHHSNSIVFSPPTIHFRPQPILYYQITNERWTLSYHQLDNGKPNAKPNSNESSLNLGNVLMELSKAIKHSRLHCYKFQSRKIASIASISKSGLVELMDTVVLGSWLVASIYQFIRIKCMEMI